MAIKKISEFTEQTNTNIAEAGTSDFVGGYTASASSDNRKFSLATIGAFVISKFRLQINGSNQTVKNAVEGVEANIGDLSSLDTTDKDSVVSAINEVVHGGVETDIGLMVINGKLCAKYVTK